MNFSFQSNLPTCSSPNLVFLFSCHCYTLYTKRIPLTLLPLGIFIMLQDSILVLSPKENISWSPFIFLLWTRYRKYFWTDLHDKFPGSAVVSFRLLSYIALAPENKLFTRQHVIRRQRTEGSQCQWSVLSYLMTNFLCINSNS